MTPELLATVLAEIKTGGFDGLLMLPGVGKCVSVVNESLHEAGHDGSDDAPLVTHVAIDMAMAMFAGSIWATPTVPGSIYEHATFEQRAAIFVEAARQSYLNFHVHLASSQAKM